MKKIPSSKKLQLRGTSSKWKTKVYRVLSACLIEGGLSSRHGAGGGSGGSNGCIKLLLRDEC